MVEGSRCSTRRGSRIPEGKKDIRRLLTDLVAKTGENVKIRRFVRYEVGEGLEKRADDFVDEVKKQSGQA